MRVRSFAVRLGLTLAAVAALVAPPSTAYAATPDVDQEYTAPGFAIALLSECCRYSAQTFTAGTSGTLVGVNVDVTNDLVPSSSPMHVAIRTVGSDGFPTGTVLGDAIVSAGSASLSDFIGFPQVVDVSAGVQYAIVIDYPFGPGPGPGHVQGLWHGGSGDPYPRGLFVSSFDDGIVWFNAAGSIRDFDMHFRTYVADTAKPLCRLTKRTATGIQISVSDVGSGLKSIDVLKAVNASVTVSAFTTGTTNPVVVNATKLNDAVSSQVALRARDMKGNVTDCDPILTTVVKAKSSVQMFRDVMQAEHWVTISNGDPGITKLEVNVNGDRHLLRLAAGRTTTLDISHALTAGPNTIALRGWGKGSADVIISDTDL